MSVSGVPSIPGFDVLFPSGNTTSINGAASNSSNNGTSNTGTANSAPATTGTANSGTASTAPASTAQPAGFDVLFPSGTVPGTSATKPPATSTANATPSSSTSTAASQNPYQSAYDNIETWSSSYLMNSVENGAPSSAGISTLSGGESAGSFAQLNSTLAALKPLIAIEGAEQNPSTTPSTSGNSSTGSSIDSFA